MSSAPSNKITDDAARGSLSEASEASETSDSNSAARYPATKEHEP